MRCDRRSSTSPNARARLAAIVDTARRRLVSGNNSFARKPLAATVLVAGTTAALPAPTWLRLEDELRTVSIEDPEVAVESTDLLMIIFTSGTTKAPKGVLNSHGRLMLLGWGAAVHMCQFQPDDCVYCAMPLFHATAQILALVPVLSAGGCIALARRFSKTSFLSDVRRYRATLSNYVGSPFAYIMDTPAHPDDADNPLCLGYGNEAPRQYIEAFSKRFGCEVIDGYGASEVRRFTPDDLAVLRTRFEGAGHAARLEE